MAVIPDIAAQYTYMCVEPLPGSSLSLSQQDQQSYFQSHSALSTPGDLLKIAQSLSDWHSIHKAEGGGGKKDGHDTEGGWGYERNSEWGSRNSERVGEWQTVWTEGDG